MDIRAHNRRAWDLEVGRGNEWSVPVTAEIVAQARRGEWEIWITTQVRPVPKSWFPPLSGARVLCLASGGGQQGPILAAIGARVTVFDNSPAQLARDREVAERECLEIRTVEGDMANLGCFPDEEFDLIVSPVSTCFVPDVRPVWREAFRVMKSGGTMMAGFINPACYIFDQDLVEKPGELKVTYRLPYSDVESLSDSEKEKRIQDGYAFEFSHTLEDLVGGQLEAGFHIVGFYENPMNSNNDLVGKYMPTCMATRAIKPSKG